MRTETVSFTVALDELKRWRQDEDRLASNPLYADNSNNCKVARLAGLTGNLGLKEWVDAAFYPVEVGQLQAGIHQAPAGVKGGAAKGPKAGAAPKERAAAARKPIKDIYDTVSGYRGDLLLVQVKMKPDTDAITTAAQKITTATTDVTRKLKEAKEFRGVLAPYLRANFAKAEKGSNFWTRMLRPARGSRATPAMLRKRRRAARANL